MSTAPRIAVVVPCYRVGARVLPVLARIGPEVGWIFVVDDACPDDTGGGPARAMQQALDDAGVTPEQIGWIKAHGTATPANDVIETRAIKEVFGEHARRLAVSSTKSQTGHCLGAAGAIEALATVLALHHGFVPPTIHLEEPDPECDLDYVPGVARDERVRVALSNSYGFGGNNTSVVLTTYS